MADETDSKPSPEDVHLQMHAAVERIRKKFNLMLDEELKRAKEELECAKGAE